LLVIMGIFLVFLATVLLVAFAGGDVRGFGLILIGPIPLIISGGAEAAYIAIAVSIAILAAMVAIILSSRAGRR